MPYTLEATSPNLDRTIPDGQHRRATNHCNECPSGRASKVLRSRPAHEQNTGYMRAPLPAFRSVRGKVPTRFPCRQRPRGKRATLEHTGRPSVRPASVRRQRPPASAETSPAGSFTSKQYASAYNKGRDEERPGPGFHTRRQNEACFSLMDYPAPPPPSW